LLRSPAIHRGRFICMEGSMESHPAAKLFPLMEGEQFAAFKADIKEHGQRDPIIVFDGKILDGRNRYTACEQLGVEPDVSEVSAEYIGNDPIAFVVSSNLHRRHLTASQRSMAGADAKAAYAEAAKGRQRAAGGNKKALVAPVPEALGEKGRARDYAAKLVGVGGRSITSAETVIKGGCEELEQAVREGRVPVKVAEQVVRKIPTKTTQRAVVLSALADDNPSATLKQHAASGGAGVNGKKEPVGVLRANEAIDCLKRIPRNDAHRERAFQIVTDWIRHNK
jgi:hypothetical protein